MQLSMPRGRRRRLLFIVLGLLAAAIVAGPNLWAWYHLARGRSELDRFHAERALKHFQQCLSIWPGSSEARLLACRAARRAGDLEKADHELRELQHRHPQPSDDVALEWALLRASGGDLESVEVPLHNQADKESVKAPLICEALATGYLRYHRTLDALACLDNWLRVQPENIGALVLRGDAWYFGRSPDKARRDYARAVELDPEQHMARWRLAQCLLDTGRYDEALVHLEEVRQHRLDDPEVVARIARCQHVLGRTKQARDLLAEALVRHPDNVILLRTQGQLDLMSDRVTEAEESLRRAFAADPEDYYTAYALANALSRLQRTEEAKQLQNRADRLKARLERLYDLTTRGIAARPLDPALYAEVGALFVEMGRKDVGEVWLQSALQHDPTYRPAHAALADLYESLGDRQQAAYHRREAGGAAPPKWESASKSTTEVNPSAN
jgi:predicted Zn-dependent protease